MLRTIKKRNRFQKQQEEPRKESEVQEEESHVAPFPRQSPPKTQPANLGRKPIQRKINRLQWWVALAMIHCKSAAAHEEGIAQSIAHLP